MIYRVSYISGGAGFQPSTVSFISHLILHLDVFLKVTFGTQCHSTLSRCCFNVMAILSAKQNVQKRRSASVSFLTCWVLNLEKIQRITTPYLLRWTVFHQYLFGGPAIPNLSFGGPGCLGTVFCIWWFFCVLQIYKKTMVGGFQI